MPYTKTVVCLANSRKLGGYCFAGKEALSGGYGDWIRPVSARPDEEISESEQTLADGNRPRLLDVVTIPMLEHRPAHHQQENHLISGRQWESTGKMSKSALSKLLDRETEELWINGCSSDNGQNDRVAVADAHSLTESLRLIKPESMCIFVQWKQPYKRGSLPEVRAGFKHNGINYNVVVTDPVAEDKYRRKGKKHTLPWTRPVSGELYLCVSLGEEFHGYCYKLVAGIIRRH